MTTPARIIAWILLGVSAGTVIAAPVLIRRGVISSITVEQWHFLVVFCPVSVIVFVYYASEIYTDLRVSLPIVINRLTGAEVAIVIFLSTALLVQTLVVVCLLHYFYGLGYCLFAVTANAYTFMLYKRDKVSAIRDEWRIPEVLLIWGGILGGFLGGFLAQRLYRHKIAKASFIIKFTFSIPVHIIAVSGGLMMAFSSEKADHTRTSQAETSRSSALAEDNTRPCIYEDPEAQIRLGTLRSMGRNDAELDSIDSQMYALVIEGLSDDVLDVQDQAVFITWRRKANSREALEILHNLAVDGTNAKLGRPLRGALPSRVRLKKDEIRARAFYTIAKEYGCDEELMRTAMTLLEHGHEEADNYHTFHCFSRYIADCGLRNQATKIWLIEKLQSPDYRQCNTAIGVLSKAMAGTSGWALPHMKTLLESEGTHPQYADLELLALGLAIRKSGEEGEAVLENYFEDSLATKSLKTVAIQTFMYQPKILRRHQEHLKAWKFGCNDRGFVDLVDRALLQIEDAEGDQF